MGYFVYIPNSIEESKRDIPQITYTINTDGFCGFTFDFKVKSMKEEIIEDRLDIEEYHIFISNMSTDKIASGNFPKSLHTRNSHIYNARKIPYLE